MKGKSRLLLRIFAKKRAVNVWQWDEDPCSEKSSKSSGVKLMDGLRLNFLRPSRNWIRQEDIRTRKVVSSTAKLMQLWQ